MKKLLRIALALMIAVSALSLTAYADRGAMAGMVATVVTEDMVMSGLAWLSGLPGGRGGGGPYYPYYPPPSVVIRESPDLYVAPQADESRYWHYCPDSKGYYPDVKKCPQGWLKVVPPAQLPAGKE